MLPLLTASRLCPSVVPLVPCLAFNSGFRVAKLSPTKTRNTSLGRLAELSSSLFVLRRRAKGYHCRWLRIHTLLRRIVSSPPFRSEQRSIYLPHTPPSSVFEYGDSYRHAEPRLPSSPVQTLYYYLAGLLPFPRPVHDHDATTSFSSNLPLQ